MKKWPFLSAVVFLALLQLIWPSFLFFFHCKPDFLLIITVLLVFYLDFRSALLFGLLAGLLKDIFLPFPFIINMVTFPIFTFLVFRLQHQISTDDNYMRLAIVLAVAVINNIIMGIGVISLGNIIPLGIFLRTVIISAVYTAIFTFLILKLIKKIAV